MKGAVVYCALVLVVLAAILNGVTCEEEKRQSRCDLNKEVVNGFKECVKDITGQEFSRETFKDNPPAEEDFKKIRMCNAKKIGAVNSGGDYDQTAAFAHIEKTQSDPKIVSEMKEVVTNCDAVNAEIDDKITCHVEEFKKICWDKQ